MIVFPNCKINLGLSIINKRNDGYHNLETIFYPLALTDALEIISSSREHPLAKTEPGIVNFSASGLQVTGSEIDNLCVKAYQLLQKDYPEIPSIQMHLLKAIPMGAGLGGGSADGAFVLRILNTLFKLDLSTSELIAYAAKLGSDCPFFIINKPCYATGRGEIMEPLPLDLSGYTFALVNCGITINTAWAFTQLNHQIKDPVTQPVENFRDVVMQPVSNWKNILVNDFEQPVFVKYPAIKSIKEQLYKYGAIYASMSGSGSTVYGIFEKTTVPKLAFPAECRVYKL